MAKDENPEETVDLFLRIGLDEKTAKNTVANNKVTTNLKAVIHEAGVTDGCSKAVGNLLYTVATKFPVNALVHRPILLEFIVSLKIKFPAQLEAAHTFLGRLGLENLELNEFEEACGIGVEVSLEEIEQTVSRVLEEKRDTILEIRHHSSVGELFGQIRAKHPWADPKIVKQVIDVRLYEMLGERTAAR